MPRLYHYVGPPEIAEHAAGSPSERLALRTKSDVLGSSLAAQGLCRFTFIVDASGELWLADRASEHVACARGGSVQAAGELALRVLATDVEVVEATNQSTGYCPEPESWGVVEERLHAAGFLAPVRFTHEFHFRRCAKCARISICKAEMPECADCGTALPERWNISNSMAAG